MQDLRPLVRGAPVEERGLRLPGRVVRRLAGRDHVCEDRGEVRRAEPSCREDPSGVSAPALERDRMENRRKLAWPRRRRGEGEGEGRAHA